MRGDGTRMKRCRMFLSKIMLVEIGLREREERLRECEWISDIKRGQRWLDHRLVLRFVQSLVFQVFKSLFYTCLLSDVVVISRRSLFLPPPSPPTLSPLSPRRCISAPLHPLVPCFFLHLYSARPSCPATNRRMRKDLCVRNVRH